MGKTYAVEQFGGERYPETITANFKETPSAAVFQGDLSVDDMVQVLRFRHSSREVAAGRTLLFLDEIQECPEAKHAIVEGTPSGNTKGGLYESFIADARLKSGHTLHFYRNESTRREVDFLIQPEGSVVPVEVKAGRAAASSLRSIMRSNHDIELAYKVADANVGVDGDGVVTVPHYMAMCLERMPDSRWGLSLLAITV